jgi:beta-glucosidase
MAATFDPEGLLKTFRYVSEEGRAKHERYLSLGDHGFLHGLTFWAPNINIFRDPRWGRGQETYGEDPYLTSQMGSQVVIGMQGDKALARYYRVVACAKHFAVHSGPEPDRHHINIYPTKRDLAQTYLVGFKALVEAGVAEIMCAYNRVNGQPACASETLFSKLRRWNYSGIVVSDCGAIVDFWHTHFTHPDAEHASADALRNGTTLECGNAYVHLVNATRMGLISESEITKAVKAIFRQRIYLGMFDPPEIVNYTRIPYSVVQCKKHAKHARLMAQESIVLLKNDGILPFNKSKRLLVVGPNADQVEMLWGNYHGYNFWGTTTILEGLKNSGNVDFHQGCDYVNETVLVDLWQEIKFSDQIGFEGKFYSSPDPDEWETPTLLKQVRRLRWIDGGEASFGGDFQATNYSAVFRGWYSSLREESLEISINFDCGMRFRFGSFVRIDKWNESRGGTVTLSVNVTANRGYLVHFEYKHYEAPGNLNVVIGRRLSLEQSLEDVKVKAVAADAIVFVGGISAKFEGEQHKTHAEGFYGGDRTRIELPKVQERFLEAMKLTGKPVIFVLCQGSASAFDTNGLSAVLNAWYPGEQGGNAVADVLYGDYNPAGRLPVTFYSSTEELNDFHNYHMLEGKGRTYRYYKGKPLFPFGYGLSYTKFKYSNLEIVGDFTKGRPIDVSFLVENIGNFAGDEVSQIYVTAIDVPNEPIKALKWFKRQQFEVAQQTEIVARLHNEAFMVYDESEDELVLRPGKFRIAVGGSSDDKDLIWKEVSFPNVIVGNNSFLWNNGSKKWIFGVIGGLIGIALTIGIVYRVKSRQSEDGCDSEGLLPK